MLKLHAIIIVTFLFCRKSLDEAGYIFVNKSRFVRMHDHFTSVVSPANCMLSLELIDFNITGSQKEESEVMLPFLLHTALKLQVHRKLP